MSLIKSGDNFEDVFKWNDKLDSLYQIVTGHLCQHETLPSFSTIIGSRQCFYSSRNPDFYVQLLSMWDDSIRRIVSQGKLLCS